MTKLEININCEFNTESKIEYILKDISEIDNLQLINNGSVVPDFLNNGTKGQIDLIDITISIIISEIGNQTYKYVKKKILSELKENNIKVKSSKKKSKK